MKYILEHWDIIMGLFATHLFVWLWGYVVGANEEEIPTARHPYKDCACHKHGEKGKEPCSPHNWLQWPHGDPCEICGWTTKPKDK